MSGNHTKLVYVCSPLRGDMEANIRSARQYCEYVVKECGAIPIAPHIYFTQFLDDDVAEELVRVLEQYNERREKTS